MRGLTCLLLSGAFALAALVGTASPARAAVVERVIAAVDSRPILLTELRTRALRIMSPAPR